MHGGITLMGKLAVLNSSKERLSGSQIKSILSRTREMRIWTLPFKLKCGKILPSFLLNQEFFTLGVETTTTSCVGSQN